MRLQLILGLFLVVHLANGQAAPNTDTPPAASPEDEQPDDTEDAPFQFTEEAAFHDMKTLPQVPEDKKKPEKDSHEPTGAPPMHEVFDV
ncbi:unnamed protein product, partial [Mesorhabditis spiculigera]